MTANQVEFEGDLTEWEYLIITLTPAVVGVIGLVITLAFWSIYGSKYFWSWLGFFLFFCGWLVSCWVDFLDAWRFIQELLDEK